VEQVSKRHGTAYASSATTLSKLDDCEDWKVVCCCSTQASSHNCQGVVDGKVNKVSEKSMEFTDSSHRSCFFCSNMENTNEAALSESVPTGARMKQR